MIFASPIWLLGLLPWAGVLVYLLRGQSERQMVPFLGLWVKENELRRPSRSWRQPPWFILLLMSSMLLAILGAAEPAWRGSSTGSGETTIILDRGISMSATSHDGRPFRGVLEQVGEVRGTVNLVPVPGERVKCAAADWKAIAARLEPTALDTQDAVEAAVAANLSDANQQVIVLSDRNLGKNGNRVQQLAPPDAVEDVGICALAARAGPQPQVMVGLRNQSNRDSATVRVSSGSSNTQQTVTLPARGEKLNYFFQMPGEMGDTVTAEIKEKDDAPVNDRAWLVRQKHWPRVLAEAGVPEPVLKMIEVYSNLRPAGDGSMKIRVSANGLDENENGAWIILGGGENRDAKNVKVLPDALTAGVHHWPGIASADAALPSGFRERVTLDGKPAVGVKDAVTRQVWVNLDLAAWSKQPDFVVFFANVFDWIATAADEEFQSSVVGAGEGQSWPGLYRGEDGKLQAYNAPDFVWKSVPNAPWNKMGHFETLFNPVLSLGGWFCLAAVLCGAAAAILWRRRSTLTAFSAGFTVTYERNSD